MQKCLNIKDIIPPLVLLSAGLFMLSLKQMCVHAQMIERLTVQFFLFCF